MKSPRQRVSSREAAGRWSVKGLRTGARTCQWGAMPLPFSSLWLKPPLTSAPAADGSFRHWKPPVLKLLCLRIFSKAAESFQPSAAGLMRVREEGGKEWEQRRGEGGTIILVAFWTIPQRVTNEMYSQLPKVVISSIFQYYTCNIDRFLIIPLINFSAFIPASWEHLSNKLPVPSSCLRLCF